jgi:chorismate synthase
MSIGAVKAVEFGEGTRAARLRGSENNDGFEAVVLEPEEFDEDEEENESGDFHSHEFHENDDEDELQEEVFQLTSNHAGGILGGMSDGAEIVMRAYFKPTPSIARPQQTANENGDNVTITIAGRHDPTVVERACVVVECMTAITILDALLENMGVQMDNLKAIYPID